MARLFVTQRELNFVSDITKELIKDVIGQKIYYYPVSEVKTLAHDVYEESIRKIVDNPIIIDCLVDSNFQSDTKIDKFGVDQHFKIEVFIQGRDLVDKGIRVSIGDFFSFGEMFFEITEKITMRNIYGMPEHNDGVKIVGTKTRAHQFDDKLIGPFEYGYTDPDALQTKFVQQRGLRENSEGATNDTRELLKNEVIEPGLSGQREVSERGALSDDSHYASSFYDEDT